MERTTTKPGTLPFMTIFIFSLILIPFLTAHAGDDYAKLRQYGYLEWVMITGAGIKLKAKLDTGADNSSIHAPDRDMFKKKGKDWVKFTIEGHNGQIAEFEKPVIRIARIEHRTGPNANRPVVRMTLCLGDRQETVEVNLADRSGLQYPMLIGRSFLEKGILINSSAKFTTLPLCNKDIK